MSTTTTLLFDLDGTLVSLEDRYVGPIIESVEEVLGEVPRDYIEDALEELLSVLGKTGFLLIPRSLWKLGRKLGMRRIQSLKFLLVSKKKYEQNRFNFRYIEGAKLTLQYALEHFRVVIITSAFRDELLRSYEQIPEITQADDIIGFHDVSKPKPSPEGILLALDRFDLEPEECIFIGDLPSDMEAASRANVRKIAFTGTYQKYTERLLRARNPDYVVHNHQELKELLASFKIEP